MEVLNQLVIVNGEDKTESIHSYKFENGKCTILYYGGSKPYSYNKDKVKILPLRMIIDPNSVFFYVDGYEYTDIEKILDFGRYYYIFRKGGRRQSFKSSQVILSENCLANTENQKLFGYFKTTAAEISLTSESGINILSNQYEKINRVSGETVLAKYLSAKQPDKRMVPANALIYPFGLNQSQKKAVENSFSSQISIIQGPPGTGKTQTILNIIANAVLNGKTVAVVSNNNSATKNVVEKLEKKGLSFLTAFLGNAENKENFLRNQTGVYPDMSKWTMEPEEREKLRQSVRELSTELNSMLDAKNKAAEIEAELLELKPEQFYFQKYYSEQNNNANLQHPGDLSSKKIISLWVEYENQMEQRGEISFFKKLLFLLRFGKLGRAVFGTTPSEAIPFLQNLYYQKRISELEAEKVALEKKLKNYKFDEKMNVLSEQSMNLFKAEVATRRHLTDGRRLFTKNDFKENSAIFVKEYPVILSTTYSIKSTLSIDQVYDYLIVDEASQVDLATGVLAYSCAKNIVIVGDLKQLPNVLGKEDVAKADAIWNRYKYDERYRFTTHSMLSSAAEIWKEAPSVLLREHYRCHPKIAGFFNKKFYNGELIVMTKDNGEKDVLKMYRTAKGNHARGHVNQRQIDVIKEEVLPDLKERGLNDIGIITPYRAQTFAMCRELGTQYEIDTVHKFQGREKEAIILTSVDNEIGEFVDDPNMLNVAVSRAVKALSVVVSDNENNEKTNYGDLAKYIEYNNFEIVDSKVHSVFDLLYKDFNEQRREFLKKAKRISEYDSENLAFAVISEILEQPENLILRCSAHVGLATLVNDYSALTEAEAKYASHPKTHVDFLLFNKMDKAPLLAIEIDGTSFHKKGSRQSERDEMKNDIFQKCNIPYLRIRTDESEEKERIQKALENVMQKRAFV